MISFSPVSMTPLNESVNQLSESTIFIPLPPKPPIFYVETDQQGLGSPSQRKKNENIRKLKQTKSYLNIFDPIVSPKIQISSSIQYFKIFMIKQNVKKFLAKLLTRVRRLPKFNLQHYKALNDKASDSLIMSFDGEKKTTRFNSSIKILKRKRSFPGEQIWETILFIMHTFIARLYNPLKATLISKFTLITKYVPVIEPESDFAKLLNIVTIIILAFYIIIIPVDIGFKQKLLSQTLISLNMLFQSIFFVVILLNFTKATFVDGQLVDGRAMIVKQYFFGNFLRDFASIAALFFSTILQRHNQSEFFTFIMVLFYLQVVPLLENSEIYSRKGLSSSKILRHIMKFVSLIMRVLFAEHIFSCLFFFVSRYLQESGTDTQNFIQKNNLDDLEWYRQYITTFYFASTTMITVGYGDLVPLIDGEKILVVIFQILSSIQLSYSVNTIGNIIQEIKIETEKNQQKIRLVNEYMETKNISSQLQLQYKNITIHFRIREYLNYYWREQEAENHLTLQQDIVNNLPEFLKSKLLKEANEHIIQQCPLLKIFKFSEPFQRNLFRIIYAINLLPESLVENEKVRLGLKGPCIFYIEKGAILSQTAQGTNTTDIEEFSQKDYFGFKEFISGEDTKLVYKSTQFSRVYCLPLNEFLDILKNFNEDNELYYDIKSQLELQPTQILSKLTQSCSACKENTHELTECGLVHFVPDRERMLKKYIFNVTQQRAAVVNNRQKQHSRFSALQDLSLVQESAANFEQENSKFMDSLYEQPSDDYTESDSDDDSDKSKQDKTRDSESIKTSKTNTKGLLEIKEEEENDNEDTQSILIQPRRQLISTPKQTQQYKVNKAPKRQTNIKQTLKKKIIPSPKVLTKVQRQSFAIQQLISQSLGMSHKQEKKQRIKFENEASQEGIGKGREDLDKIYKDEKIYLTLIERHRFMYFGKMSHFLSKNDLKELDNLHIQLRVLLNPQSSENFESNRVFNTFKIKDNLDKVLIYLKTTIVRVRSKQFIPLPIGINIYPGGRVIQLVKYMLYPFSYEMRYGKNKTSGQVNTEGDFTDCGGSVGLIKSPRHVPPRIQDVKSPSSPQKNRFLRSQVVPLSIDD